MNFKVAVTYIALYTLTFCAFAFLIFALVVDRYVVRGISMEPTYSDGDSLFVVPITNTYALRRGTIVLYRDPRAHDHPLEIKRIIGLPQETVVIHGGVLSVRHSDASITTYAVGTFFGRSDNGADLEMYLGPEDYFLMGDNRAGSKDSRHFGTIQQSEMMGLVVW